MKELIGGICGPVMYNNISLSLERQIAVKEVYEQLQNLQKEELELSIWNATPVELSFSDKHFLRMGLTFEEKEMLTKGF